MPSCSCTRLSSRWVCSVRTGGLRFFFGLGVGRLLMDEFAWTRRKASYWNRSLLGPSFADRCQEVADRLGSRLGTNVALAVKTNTHGVGRQVAWSNHQHGMDLGLLG